MALKINITLDNHEDFNLMVQSIEHFRLSTMIEAQEPGCSPAQNSKLIYQARQLQNLMDKITKN